MVVGAELDDLDPPRRARATRRASWIGFRAGADEARLLGGRNAGRDQLGQFRLAAMTLAVRSRGRVRPDGRDEEAGLCPRISGP